LQQIERRVISLPLDLEAIHSFLNRTDKKMSEPSPVAQTASGEIDWKKILGIGAAVVVGGAVLFYFLGGSDRRSNLKEAEQKFGTSRPACILELC
jgi:hypothetical protein